MPNFNEQAWLEGFINEAAAMGLDKQAAQELLKTAVRREVMQDNPAFAVGFQRELEKQSMEKDAINWAALLGILGVGGATALGGRELFNKVRMRFDKSPEQQQLGRMMEQGAYGSNQEDLASQLNFTVGQQMANRAARRGAMYHDPSFNPQQWMNMQRPASPGFQLGW